MEGVEVEETVPEAALSEEAAPADEAPVTDEAAADDRSVEEAVDAELLVSDDEDAVATDDTDHESE
jgi:hypothetical protein